MSCIRDIIQVYENSGLEECIKLVTTEMEESTSDKDVQSETTKSIKSLVAKYKNLHKNKNPAAERELESFLSSLLSSVINKEPTTSTEELKPAEGNLPHSRIPLSIKPIGYMESVFHYKNGTPRQSGICKTAMGKLTILKSVFNNPEHSLMDLQQFSHMWIIFWFHQNANIHTKAKVKPPRMDGKTTGVFSTRSPYRPNPIGLTLAKIETIKGDTVYLSGIDIVDGTPILDIKPFIAAYDQPSMAYAVPNELAVPASFEHEKTQPSACEDQVNDKQCSMTDLPEPSVPESKAAKWISEPPVKELDVRFSTNAKSQLAHFSASSSHHSNKMEYLQDASSLQQAIVDILKSDPRSTYRRRHCDDRLYYFVVDTAHVTCWFDDSCAEVLKVKPVAESDTANLQNPTKEFDVNKE